MGCKAIWVLRKVNLCNEQVARSEIIYTCIPLYIDCVPYTQTRNANAQAIGETFAQTTEATDLSDQSIVHTIIEGDLTLLGDEENIYGCIVIK